MTMITKEYIVLILKSYFQRKKFINSQVLTNLHEFFKSLKKERNKK